GCMNLAGAQQAAARSASSRDADLTIVGGGGHVGIPLMLAFADAGFRVNVHDLNREVLATLQAGRLPFIEHGGGEMLARALKQDRLVFAPTPSAILPRRPAIF